MKPRIPITDKRFVYVPAIKTDIKETWRKAREQPTNVRQINKGKVQNGK